MLILYISTLLQVFVSSKFSGGVFGISYGTLTSTSGAALTSSYFVPFNSLSSALAKTASTALDENKAVKHPSLVPDFSGHAWVSPHFT